MNISKTELLRIAQICRLSFSDEELEHLRQSLETTIQESKQLFETNNLCPCDEGYHDTPLADTLKEIAQKNFGYCRPELNKT